MAALAADLGVVRTLQPPVQDDQMITAAVLIMIAAPSPPSHLPLPHSRVPADQVEGTTLCVTNPDGTSLLIDSPSADGEWRMYDGGGGWFAGRWSPVDGDYVDVVSFGRIWGMMTCEDLSAGLVKERRDPKWPEGWEIKVDACGLSDVPEPGSLRVLDRHLVHGAVANRSVQYVTPRGYNFVGKVDELGNPERAFDLLLHSYRVVPDRGCGPVPEHPRRRRTTKR